jgi:hypothetical protein
MKRKRRSQDILSSFAIIVTMVSACSSFPGQNAASIPVDVPTLMVAIAMVGTASLTAPMFPTDTVFTTPTSFGSFFVDACGGITLRIEIPRGWIKDPKQMIWHVQGSVDAMTIWCKSTSKAARWTTQEELEKRNVKMESVLSEGAFSASENMDAYKVIFQMKSPDANLIDLLYVLHIGGNSIFINFQRLTSESGDIDNLIDAIARTAQPWRHY